MAQRFVFRLIQLFILVSSVHAQALSVPPLQWLNISGALHGTSIPPPLKDAAIGYDPLSRTVIVFGGESGSGIPQSQTYLLDLDSLTWSSPAPPDGLSGAPAARSAAVFGSDFAASNRHGFIVIGGKGLDGNALSDVWEFDFLHQFWSQVQVSPGGPSARWGAGGGIDPRVAAVSDPIVPGPNNTFYYVGGVEGSTLSPLSELWRLNVSGTLSSNLPNNVAASWEDLSISRLTASSDAGLASAVLTRTIALSGGCNTTSGTDDSCATQDTFVLNADSLTSITLSGCSAPRVGAAMVPNMNTISTSFNSQVFLLLGTFNTSLWSDDDGLEKGEVAILDTGGGTWTRLLPSGDPGSSGSSQAFPSPREGSAAVSSSSPLVGASQGTYSDTIVFGGRDSTGTYLNEVWILRAYGGTVSSSGAHWSGFGDGTLQSGVNATGTGVSIQYLTTCATRSNGTTTSPSHTSSSPSGTSSSPSSTSSSSIGASPVDTAVSHKILAPLSLALLLPAILVLRTSTPIFNNDRLFTGRSMAFLGLVTLMCYGLAIAGVVTSFTTITASPTSNSLSRRSSTPAPILGSSHAKASLIFFIGLYVLVPLLWILSRFTNTRSADSQDSKTEDELTADRERTTSMETAEKLRSVARSSTPGTHTPSRPPSPRQRTQSWGPSSIWRPSHERRLSSDSESNSSAGPVRSFEVVNRPPRGRRVQPTNPEQGPRTLGEIDWLQRRRSLNTVGELDYFITQATRAREHEAASTPATTDRLTQAPLNSSPRPQLPSSVDITLHLLLQLFVAGLAVICLVALWSRSTAGFVVFLVWTVLFYVTLFVLAWNGKPTTSILTLVIARLRAQPYLEVSKEYMAPSTPPVVPVVANQYPFPPSNGPYVHEPPYRAATSTDLSHGGPRSVETDDDDDDEDEDARQQRIESEIGRREIVTVTVPKRRLWVANPS